MKTISKAEQVAKSNGIKEIDEIRKTQNEFLNYWNCKIISFSVDNIKNSSFYSINGDIYAIFALAEEYIIAPSEDGNIYFYSTINDKLGKIIDISYTPSKEIKGHKKRVNNITFNL